MPNLSQLKRQRMIEFLEKLRSEHTDDESIRAFTEIENHIRDKKYGLVWEEHSEHVDEMLKDNIPIFTEDTEKKITVVPDGKYNFILEGDNLQSLYLLEKTHKGRVDVIYIDPPYNTGNSFIYNDSIVGDEDAFKHSKWLSFMSARLKIARELLTEEGVIFISINDYELATLRLLCDEIFDEFNFIAQLTWESTTQPTNAGKARFSLQKKVESIFCFAKNKNKKRDFILKELETGLHYPHVGKFGPCRFEIIEKSDAGAYRRDSMKFSILGHYPRPGKRWQIGLNTARKLELEGKVEIVDGIVKKAVYPEDEIDKRKFVPFWSHLTAENVGTALNGKEELNQIMGNAVGFDTVKPVKLIKEIISHFGKECTILDFFAGSGTTAQAVIELNSIDDGQRSFILCTSNESGICENITYPRVSKVINGYSFLGKKEEVLFEKNLTLRGLQNIVPVLEEAKSIEEANVDKYKNVTTTFKEGVLKVVGECDTTEGIEGIPANVKYFKCDWTVRKPEDYLLSNALCLHIKEMIELQNAIEVDNVKNVLILNKAEFQRIVLNDEAYNKIENIWVNQNIVFNADEMEKLKALGFRYIPKEFFGQELKEAAE